MDVYTHFSSVPNLPGFLQLQKYSWVTDYYKLFCFWQILFPVCSLLILMNLWVLSEGMNHREVGIQYILNQYEFRMSSQQYLSGDFFILMELTSFLLSFVLWSFQVLGKDSMDYRIRSGKSLTWGCPRNPKVIFKDNQEPKLGDAPDGIPSFVFVHR